MQENRIVADDQNRTLSRSLFQRDGRDAKEIDTLRRWTQAYAKTCIRSKAILRHGKKMRRRFRLDEMVCVAGVKRGANDGG